MRVSRALLLCLLAGCTQQSFTTLPSVDGSNGNLGSQPSPSPTPVPTLTPAPTPAPTTTPAPAAKILWGVNGHDRRLAYPLSQSEAVFKMLDQKNLRTYRVDVTYLDTQAMDVMVPLAKKYKIKLRPMLYVTTQANAYNFVKRYAADVDIWELGNELDHSKVGAQDRVNQIFTTYKGVKQVASEMGLDLKISVNIMACNVNDVSATARCPGDKNGAMWFLDMAYATGVRFDFITFHYYAGYGDKGYWMDMYLSQMRAVSEKYKAPIFYNELHCAEIYRGTTDSGFPGDKGCYDSVDILFTELTTKYSDILAEVNMYELMDEPENDGVEKHFGLMYNINSPKKIFDLLVKWANK